MSQSFAKSSFASAYHQNLCYYRWSIQKADSVDVDDVWINTIISQK